jgi:bacterioferritin-associated ferredoxin
MDKNKYKYEIDCACNNVPCEQIKKVIFEHNCKSANDVRKYIRVANRCRACEPFIDEWCQHAQELE